MGRSTWSRVVQVLILAATLLVLASAGSGALPDGSNEVSSPNFDIVEVDAGMLPPGHRMIPRGTQGIAVWVRLRFRAPFPPPDTVQGWAFSDSKFFPDPDKPGQTIHVSGSYVKNSTQGTLTRSSCAPDSSSCPPAFPVSVFPQPDGSLVIVNGLASRPQQVSIRAAATFLLPGTTDQIETDQFPDNEVPVPVDMTPVDPVAPPTEEQPPQPPRAETDDGGSSTAIIIVVVAVVALLGLGLLVLIVRRRPKVPPACDWELRYDDGTKGGRVLRKAQGTRCCVYTIEVGSAYHMPEWVEWRRQLAGPDHGGPDSDRLRLVGTRGPTDVGLGFVNLELDVRSGPAGTQDWMQGTGETAPDGESTVQRLLAERPEATAAPEAQSWPFEETPDVAGHLVWTDDTKIQITGARQCPTRFYYYACDGQGEVGLGATHECTNASASGSDCPVELSTVADVTGEVRGGINYLARARTAGTPDDLDGTGSALAPDPVHAHPDRARDARRVTGQDAHGAAVEDDSVRLQVVNRAALDAGQTVPIPVFPTTDRVWTYLTADVGHQLQIVHQPAPDQTPCEGPCCGNPVCRCRPAFSVTFQRTGGATIDVEGKRHRLDRRTGALTYEAWQLA